jgi:hypothetical protein
MELISMSDLAELFARDPLTLTDPDISKIIEEMRKSRHAFNLGNMMAGSTKPKTEKQKQIIDLGSKLGISI